MKMKSERDSHLETLRQAGQAQEARTRPDRGRADRQGNRREDKQTNRQANKPEPWKATRRIPQ